MHSHTQGKTQNKNPSSAKRLALFAELGLTEFLSRRHIWSIGDLPIHCEVYEHSPEAPTLIFLPGIGTYSELYCELLARLSDEGFNLVAVDLRGHGYSGGARGYYDVDTVTADLQQVLDKIEQVYPAAIGVFGCSIGARLGLALAEQDTRVRSLLCHTLFLAELPPDIWHSLGWSNLFVAHYFMPDFKINFRTFIDVDELLRHNPMGKYIHRDDLLVWDYPVSTLHSLFSHPSRVLKESIQIPTAILVGSNDPVISPDYIRSIQAQCTQRFDIIEIKGGSHMLPFDHIDDTLEACTHWFKKHLY